ncbi:MAG: zinc ribbon domain-containing protein [Candidatus Bathyarchaeia archaeon]
MPNCPNCGAENPPGAKYCDRCGKPMIITRIITPLQAGPGQQLQAQPWAGIAVPPVGSCSYHPSMPASAICGRCGRSICAYCSIQFSTMRLCPDCYEVFAKRV